ncbi:MAG: DUF1501 domain-containing protein [Bacteroidota bacterium]
MKRRDFLKYGSRGLVLPTLAGGFASKALGLSPLTAALNMVNETNHILVVIFMDGGNDGLNTVVPMDQYENLQAVRPHVIIPENKLLPLSGTNVALHPSMGKMRDLFNENRLQIIQNVGYPNPNFSHFRSSDIWMSGSDADVVINSGWSGRYLNYEYPNFPEGYPNETNPHPLAVEIGWNTSLLFQGPSNPMSMVITEVDSFYDLVDEAGTGSDYPDTIVGDRLAYVNEIQKQSQRYGEIVVDAAKKVTSQQSYPDYYLAEQLKIVARLIAGGLQTRMYFVRIDGFDTHSGQVDGSDHTKGEHANLLHQLSESVSAFVKDLDALNVSDRVMGMTLSEFGRRIVSNNSNGTDHGTAAPLFLFGNAVKGGVTGQNPIIDPNSNYEDNLDMQHDFRQVYSSVFDQWLCVDRDALNQIFMSDYESLAVASSGTSCITPTHEVNEQAGVSYLNVNPNPAIDHLNIEFSGLGKPTFISLHGLDGRLLKTVVNSHFPKGPHRLQLSLNGLPSGTYFLTYQTDSVRQSKQFVKL